MQGSLAYTDGSLRGYDAAVLSEEVEHVDPPRLPALAHAVFGAARPRTVVITTPNAEYNVRWSGLAAGRMRHADHRFEWTRQEFRAWAEGVARRYGYGVEFRPVGPDDSEVGPPTQLALFTLNPPAAAPTRAGDRTEAGTAPGPKTDATTDTTIDATPGTKTDLTPGTKADPAPDPAPDATPDPAPDQIVATVTVQRDEVTS